MEKSLTPVVGVDSDKCVNCQVCIAACPVSFCNDASSDHVEINHDMCIGCGQCIRVCTHKARFLLDDTDQFLKEASSSRTVAIVAPAVACVFPDEYLRLNGWLKSIGMEAVFDVSFGAELTVYTYLEYIKKHQPTTLIAQPCPVIVNYLEIYHPELLAHLAPVDSPMGHTMKMIREFYPKYKHHKIAVISPCMAKKREFAETGIGDYNVTMAKLKSWLKENRVRLQSFPETDYDNPPAERAVEFSSPGGLLKTVQRYEAGKAVTTRKIEGPHTLFKYLDTLKAAIDSGRAPMLLDCLNCEHGCNGGTATGDMHHSPDELEYHIGKRSSRMRSLYKKSGFKATKRTRAQIEKQLQSYWKDGLYVRKYQDRSANNTIKTPSEAQLKENYRSMGKFRDSDHYNCSACGYNSCEKMAQAIFNDINRPENCSHYIMDENKKMIEEIRSKAMQDKEIATINDSTQDLFENMKVIAGSISELGLSITEISENAQNSKDMAEDAAENVKRSESAFENLQLASDEIPKVLDLINTTVDNLKLLALNAKIEAASAGEAGKGFNVVAMEVKTLADTTSEATGQIEETTQRILGATDQVNQAMEALKQYVENLKEYQISIASAVEEQTANTSQVADVIQNLTRSVETISENIHRVVN